MGNPADNPLFTNYAPITSRTFIASLVVEFLGTMLFAFLGSTVQEPLLAPFVNGLALTVLIYTAANISGGHLNPAVTASTLLCGYYPVLHALLYILLQIAGAIFGSLLAAGLLPNMSIGMGAGGAGCFEPVLDDTGRGLSHGQLFGWEVLMTFVLISTVFACGIARPGHGSLTPLAVGLSLTACAGTGGKWTGAALNPARVIGPAAVFHCSQEHWWIYVLAELLAAVFACAVFSFVSGFGPLCPIKSRELGLTAGEALRLWLDGQPPARLARGRSENMQDVEHRLRGDAKAAA